MPEELGAFVRIEGLKRQVWLNFLALLPQTGLTLLTIAVAFLRFDGEQDFAFPQAIGHPRLWHNRRTVTDLLVALVNFGVEWSRRNRATDRLTHEAKRSTAEAHRSAEAREGAVCEARIQNGWIILQIQHQTAPSDQTRSDLRDFLEFLQEHGV